MRKLAVVLVAGLFAMTLPLIAQQQIADPQFDPRVDRPAFVDTPPRIGIDEAHKNFHTRNGRYQPFAALLEADGYTVSAVSASDAGTIGKLTVLVIANALGDPAEGRMGPAFTPRECDIIRDWVRGGGSLLLIADHAPFGEAAAELARRFGVEMGKGYVLDRKHSENNNPTQLVFAAEEGLLGDHAIVRGRRASERIRRVVSFTGQSLSVPAGATPLLKISDGASEAFTEEDFKTLDAGGPAGTKLSGRAQGIAMPFGKGRLAMFGEAAMFSAQIATFEGQSMKMGMNVAGNDDRQFLLNVIHWLSRVID